MKKEKQMLVSIVIPVYNVESYLEECLDSVLSQTYEKVEILLIDDGSTDKSGEICDQYARHDFRVRVFHNENQGVSSARNLGIREAAGEYLIFVDADDCVHRQMVEIYMDYADGGRVLLCELSSDKEILEQHYDNREAIYLEQTDRRNFMLLFCMDHIHSPVKKLYRTKLLKEKQIYFPADRNLGEDLFFNLDYFRYAEEEYTIIHVPLYYYRENRSGSLTTSYHQDLFEVQQDLFQALRCFLEEMDIWDEENSKIYYGIYWDRMYLTAVLCRAYERGHGGERQLQQILRSSLWQEIWEECKKRGVANWKRRMKAIMLKLYRLKL